MADPKTAYRKTKVDENQIIFVVEACNDCPNHHMTTWHKVEQYINKYIAVADALQTDYPGSPVLLNQVPKNWHQHPLYVQLIANNDADCNLFDMVPRLGSFEVSTVF